MHMKKFLTLSAFLAAVVGFTAVTDGCISNTKYGCEVTETLAPGASEGEVIMKHGAPDNIVYLGTPYYNPQTGERGEVDKYLYEYRIGGGTTLLGLLFADDRFHNIAYLIEGGRVMGGGYVGEGSGLIILGLDYGYFSTPLGTIDLRFGGFLHPKARAGYGGDGMPGGGAHLGVAAGSN
jgi:hypothetical protein